MDPAAAISRTSRRIPGSGEPDEFLRSISDACTAIDPADGLFHRPARPWCKAMVEDCALQLYALTTLAVALAGPKRVGGSL